MYPRPPKLRAAPQHTSRMSSQPITKTIGDTCQITGLGRTKIYELIAEGKLKATAVGRRRLVFYASMKPF